MRKHKTCSCPITNVIMILSDSWTMRIMRILVIEGPGRFSELEKALEGISSRTLTLKLKKLVEEDLIQKSSDGTYSPTAKGAGLKIIVRAMRKYNDLYLKKQ
jgi:DNA-binding HxlR family transcriptional regulator